LSVRKVAYKKVITVSVVAALVLCRLFDWLLGLKRIKRW
jgi:hypothetical protein